MDGKRKKRRPQVRGNTKKPVKNTRKTPREEVVRAPVQEVVYTAPDPISRKRLILSVVTMASIVLALFLACTVFFKVEKINVSGNVKYDEWTIFEASGIEKGDSLLTFGKGKACARIAQSLPYVKIVRIGITLPNTVNIYVEELDVVYAAQDTKDGWWLLTSGGRVVEKTSASVAKGKTKLQGFRIENPVVGEGAKAYEPKVEAGEETHKPVTVTNAERLDAALLIVSELERREVLGQVSSVNVADLGNIVLWYGKTYDVRLGDRGQLEEKLGMMVQTIRSREAAGNNQGGVLDISFELYPSAVGFQPFDLKEEDADCAMQDTNESWWLLTADGQVVKKTSASLAKEKLLLEGIVLQGPVVGQGAQVFEEEVTEGDEEPVISNQERLNVGLYIVAQLDQRGVLSRIASVNVTDMEGIVMWYGETYEIHLGNAEQLDTKLQLMCEAITDRENSGNTQAGILDITLQINPDAALFQPFE